MFRTHRLAIPLLALLLSSPHLCLAADTKDPPLKPDLVKWRKDWSTAIEEAKAKDKPVMAVFFSKSCGWCKSLRRSVFVDEGFARFVNTRFVPVLLYGEKELRKKYGVEGSPQTVIVEPESQAMIHMVYGFRKATSFTSWLHMALAEREFLADSPNDFATYCNSAYAIQKHKKPAKELPVYEELAKKHPRVGVVWARVGSCRFWSGDYKGAIPALEKALRLGAGNEARTRYQLATAYFCTGNYRKAGQHYAQNQATPLERNGYREAANVWVTSGLLGREKQATPALKAYLDRQGSRPREAAWPYAVADRVAGRYGADRLDHFAANLRGKREEAQAAYYHGVYALIVERDKAKAKRYLKQCVDYNEGGYELPQARALLKKL